MKDKIILYTIGCPKCVVIERKLKSKNVIYEEVRDVEQIQAKGILSVPCLEVNGERMEFSKAVKYVNSLEAF